MKAHLIKGSAAAKAYMAKLRSKKTKVGAVKKKAAPKKKVGAVKKKAVSKKKVVKIKGLSNDGYCIKKGNLYLTRKSLSSNFSFTDNENFRYVFEDKKQAEQLAKEYGGKAILNKFYATIGKKITGLSKAKKLQKKLKSEGMKLTKGYDLQKRKRIGSIDYEIQLTRVNNDLNGNPRYVVHFLNFLNDEENTFLPFNKKYDYALLKAKKIGGKKFHNKQYGGGIVFQSYNTDILKKNIIDLKHTTPQIKY